MNHSRIFQKKKIKKLLQEGYKVVDAYLGNDFPLIVGGERITTEAKIKSYNPAKKEELVGAVSKATQEIASKAMDIADETFKTWKKVKPEIRADVLFKAAAIIRRRKFEFSALLSREAGKTWVEADVEVPKELTSWNTMVVKCYVEKMVHQLKVVQVNITNITIFH